MGKLAKSLKNSIWYASKILNGTRYAEQIWEVRGTPWGEGVIASFIVLLVYITRKMSNLMSYIAKTRFFVQNIYFRCRSVETVEMVLNRTDVNEVLYTTDEQPDTSVTMNTEKHTSPTYDTKPKLYSTEVVTSPTNDRTSQLYNGETVTSPTNVTTSQLYNGEIVTIFNDEGLYLVWNSWHTVHVIVLVIAVIGNSLAFGVCMRRVNRKKSFMLYLAALAFFDTLNSIQFLVPLLNYVPSFSWGSPEVYCKLTGFIFDSAKYISSWLVVAISLERTISTKIPHHVARFSSPMFGIKTISIIVAVSFIFNIHLLFGWTGETNGSVIWCYTVPGPYSLLWRYLHPFIDALFYSMAPGTMLILCNTVMIKAVFASAKIRGPVSGPAARRNRDLLIVAVLVSMFFIMLTSPFPLFLIISGKSNFRDRTEVEIQIYNITRLMGYINNAINFFLYVISGSRFRNQLKEMLHCNTCRHN